MEKEFFRQCVEKHFQTSVIFCIDAPLTDDNQRQEGALVLGERAIYLCRRTDGGEPELREYALEGFRQVELEQEQGSVWLRAVYRGEDLSLCRADLAFRRSYEEAAKWLKAVCEEGLSPREVRFVYRSGVCEKCGARLAPGSNVCHRCASGGSAVKRIWQFVSPFRLRLFFGFFLFLLTALINVAVPRMNRIMIDSFIQAEDPASVTFSGLIAVVSAIALANVLSVGVGILRNNLLARVSTDTVCSLRHALYAHVQKMSVSGVTKYSAGELLTRLSGDTRQIASFLTGQMPAMLEQVLLLFAVGGVMIAEDPLLALLVLLPVPLVFLMFRLIWHMTQRLYRKQWVVNSKANTVLHDIFRGIRVVKVFGTERRELKKYDDAVKDVRDVSIRNETVWASVMPYANFILGIGSFIVLYYVGKGILGGTMSLGQLTMYSSYVSLLYAPLKWMARLPRILQRTATSVSKVLEVIDDDSVLREKPSEDRKLKGFISVEDVSFGYLPARPVLKHVSVQIKPGEMLGIVGRSGAGKSTLINLIMRLYDPDSGRILVDGTDVRDISQHCLRSHVGVVLQENFLFTGTIWENIAYARPEASREEVIDAAKKAGAHSFIMKLPDGYNSYVGESGYTLSGGERQRIAIARAILHDPAILILDEATSALDTETESHIQEALANLIKDRTTIAIAHRLSTLRNATKLLVLDKNTVAELGTHEELMKQKGIYYDLVMAQRQMSKMEQ